MDLGNLSAIGVVRWQETIGNNAAAGADVDWYQFSLAQPSFVVLHAGSASGFAGVLTLYNNDPNSPDPMVATLRNREVAQAQGD